MNIQFCLDWADGKNSVERSFKSRDAYRLVCDYAERISRFIPCSVSGKIAAKRESGLALWVCDRSPNAKILSSEEMAKHLERILNSGAKTLEIVIGGADGFSREKLDALKPSLLWSFGPLTLPHELAAVVAAEQVYRGFTIIKKQPYHLGH